YTQSWDAYRTQYTTLCSWDAYLHTQFGTRSLGRATTHTASWDAKANLNKYLIRDAYRDVNLGRQFGTPSWDAYMYLNSGRVSAYKSWDAQLGTRIYTQKHLEFTKIDTNSQQNTKKSQKITENHIEIQKIHNISMKFTYNPTKKTFLGGSRIEKYIYIYIYIYIYTIFHTFKRTSRSQTPRHDHKSFKKKFIHTYKRKK